VSLRRLRKKEGKYSQSSTNAYSRKGRVRKKLYTNACKKKKRRKNRPQLPMAKKDQTTNVDGKRKRAALIRQANS